MHRNLQNYINNLNPEFMKNLFKVRKTNRAQREQYKLNLEIQKSNQVYLVLKVCAYKALKVWNALPFHIKLKENLQAFKDATKFWDGSNVVVIFVLILIFSSLMIYQLGLLFVCINLFCIRKKFRTFFKQ